ncbi:hypothetical protein IAT38_002519 [Cryptococcus sp. DSM 104549]
MATPIPVILFKTPSPSPSADPYTLAFQAVSSSHAQSGSPSPSSTTQGYRPQFIPVLQEAYHISPLVEIISQSPAKWEGMVVTSRRGMEGWVRGVKAHLQGSGKGKEREDRPVEESGDGLEEWADVPLFSVGSTSVDHLAEADIPPSFKPSPVPEMRGTPPKSAGPLSQLILDTSPRARRRQGAEEAEGEGWRPYLFLCGNKSLEEMPATLRGAGRVVEDLMVYATSAREDVLNALESLDTTASTVGWLSFFSPSSAAIVLPLMRDGEGQTREKWVGWKVFAIGETTRRYLEEQGVKVNAVADQPSAEGTVDAITKART